MSQPRPDIHQWQTWRQVEDDDTAISILDPAAITAAVSAKSINVNPRFNAVVIRAFGKDTAADTATYKVYGFMDPSTDQRRTGAGPPFQLVNGTISLSPASDSIIPLANNPSIWGAAAATWFPVDDWTLTGNAAGAVSKFLNNLDAILILPTWGFNNLYLEVTNIGGGGTEITELGVMYRPLYVSGMSHIGLVA